jgi:hypothetical protein
MTARGSGRGAVAEVAVAEAVAVPRRMKGEGAQV